MPHTSQLFCTVLLLVTTALTSTHAKDLLNLEDNKAARGYDVVSYVADNVAKRGNPDITHTVDDVIYQFSSEEHKQLFIQQPETYQIAYGGWCAYAMADGEKVNIDPKTFTLIDGKIYLFYNGFWGDTLKKWNNENPDDLKVRADAAWEKILTKHKQ